MTVRNLIPTVSTTYGSAWDEAALRMLQSGLSGELFRPGDPGYDKARQLWNGAVDKHPALIIRCATSQDVVLAVNFGRRHNLPVSVRGGGHNTAGLALCDGGLVIDLSAMKGLTVDPTRRVARAEPGLTIGELARALQPYNLLTPTGTCSGTGIAGSTLGGGIGWLTGKYGLAVDNVLAFEIVTADGQLRQATAHENADLFWALRGGGGNFGIVAALEYQLHPVGKVLGGMALYPQTDAEDVLRFYRDFSSAAPDELTTYCVLMVLPGLGPVIAIIVCYSGADLTEGERVIAPLRQFGAPVDVSIRPMDYTEMIALLDPAAPDGRSYYDTAYSLKEPGDEALVAIAACAATMTSPFSAIVIHHVNGAATRIAADETAYALREPHYAIVNAAAWIDGPGSSHIEWANNSLKRMQPFVNLPLYVNFMGIGGEAEIRDSYRNNYERLVTLKRKYDPTNFFHHNQNIKPVV